MNLYLISRQDRWGYDEYDSAVVACGSEDEARGMHPAEGRVIREWGEGYGKSGYSWASCPEDVAVIFLGVADEYLLERGVVCSSFNAG